MKLLKILTLQIAFSIFPIYSYAQIDIGSPGIKSKTTNQSGQSEAAYNNTVYVATIIGYGKKCSMDDFKLEQIKGQLFKNLNVIGLDSAVVSRLKDVEQKVENIASNKNLTIDECKNIINVVNKITDGLK